jgi:RNA polymerase sigma-70 factor (ECF subfamily)
MDVECFKKKYLPYASKLYCVAYQLLENQADAEDMVQELYLKLWDKRSNLSIVNNAEAFSVTLIKNMCLDTLRSNKYCLTKQTEDLCEAGGQTDEQDATIHEDVYLVKQLIKQLPESQRRIIKLRDIDGYSFQEIEKVTSLNATNVRVLLSRARKKIRELFKQTNDEQRRTI